MDVCAASLILYCVFGAGNKGKICKWTGVSAVFKNIKKALDRI